MHKFFITEGNIHDNNADIYGDDVKHIYRVLRLKEGEKININNSQGKEYIGEITYIDKNKVQVHLLEELQIQNESLVNIFLFQGLPKSVKMDLIVQKATELGVSEITPIITERVIIKNELGEFNKTERWKRIALEASKQSKRGLIPKVKVPIEFDELLKLIKNIDLVVVPYENERGYGIKQMIKEIDKSVKSIAIIIGPEGGFEKKEIELLSENGAKIITLGPRILRTETAGFVCVSLLQYELGDLGGMNL